VGFGYYSPDPLATGSQAHETPALNKKDRAVSDRLLAAGGERAFPHPQGETVKAGGYHKQVGPVVSELNRPREFAQFVCGLSVTLDAPLRQQPFSHRAHLRDPSPSTEHGLWTSVPPEAVVIKKRQPLCRSPNATEMRPNHPALNPPYPARSIRTGSARRAAKQPGLWKTLLTSCGWLMKPADTVRQQGQHLRSHIPTLGDLGWV
jgi:hypothetical protein